VAPVPVPAAVSVPARIASSEDVLGRVKLRVVPVLIPDSENIAFFVGSASFTKLKMASDTSAGSPTGSHAVPFHTTKTASSATYIGIRVTLCAEPSRAH
jgi:hypothetical protein